MSMVSSCLSYGFQCLMIIKKFKCMNSDVNLLNIRCNHENYHQKICIFATPENNKDGTLVAFNGMEYHENL